MVYVWLIIAIMFETGWAVAMKLSDGFTRVGPAAVTIVLYLLSVVFLALAAKRMELSIAYAIWAGSGAALIALAGILYFKEPITAAKAASLLLIIAGIVGLQLSGGGH
ncbi:MAG TPA: multidrug efflux SMR transporter [Phycisphaerae bacterium]|jgi:multidrug transporter EmrE-like cation transporter|nr:multidrug efflux SMR transporter [Phycisphaerae bacterium]HOB75365.1 multidrug efflux SMR transporter [Phycisphaerae bacterium]HOJ55527.1 multidrug efflux SMR transporter [Phycisphaerae bacterium]HOL26037.1 multidrug efflux SMR transporter [Phycisphaerae bacterium]HPP22557.1 multidrug efflux SMR transporter [Phycisphaerae bacterium]